MTFKWIFFDVGSTLVDETEAYDHRVREMIAGTSITFKEFNDARIALAQQGLDGNSAAIKHFGLTKTPWHSEDEVPYSDAHSTLVALIDKGYKLGIIANQKIGTAERLESWGLRQYFDVIAASAEIGYAKPDKEIFEKAFELAKCTAAESVMVGDRLDNDIIPAKAIGMKTVWVKNGLAQYQDAELIGLVIGNGLSVSEFLLFFSAVGGFTAWVSGILGGFNTLHTQSLDISSVRECLEYPEPFKFEDGEPIEAEADRLYEIKLENVSFRYPGADKNTLTNINLTLHPGEKLAVVGLNGAGKTTLIKLVCGFLDPTEGRILLDGKDIRDYNRRDYYKMFSAVFQEFSLLAGSIATNVAQDSVGIDMERVMDCVEKAGLRKKIESLKDGYETYLNREVFEEAVLLSGGETQRLMLARALYKNAPFIVLDEPTAALDPIAESEMYQKYHEMTSGKSSIYISHRLASTRFCDRIIMIADGGIGEEGTHEELIKAGGRYAELFEVQSKYYKEGEEENEEN